MSYIGAVQLFLEARVHLQWLWSTPHRTHVGEAVVVDIVLVLEILPTVFAKERPTREAPK
jgi:hypothetical protein